MSRLSTPLTLVENVRSLAVRPRATCTERRISFNRLQQHKPQSSTGSSSSPRVARVSVCVDNWFLWIDGRKASTYSLQQNLKVYCHRNTENIHSY